MIEGSQPRKFITKTIFTNPSLYSVSVTSLFDPENKHISKVYEALEQKQQVLSNKEANLFNEHNPQRFARQASQYQLRGSLKEPPSSVKQILSQNSAKRQWDSLEQAQKQFLQKKQPRAYDLPRHVSEKRDEAISKQPVMGRISRGNSTPSLYGLHYTKTSEIKSKQAKPFNIINNI